MQLSRLIRHLLTTRFSARQRFPRAVLDAIEGAIREAEASHAGQIAFAVEASLDMPHLWHRVSGRQRALQVFAQLGVWDTAANNGVLIYVLLADRVVEIVADRGIAARVAQHEWDGICREMEAHFRAGKFALGATEGVRRTGELLARHFPGGTRSSDELSDRPVML